MRNWYSALPLAGVMVLVMLLPFVLPAEEGALPASLEKGQGAETGDRLLLADWPPSEGARRGHKVFELYCVGCHGLQGLGDGVSAPFLNPKPRNFQKGEFKFRTTESGQLPMESDVMRTVTCGLPGSAMPAFPLVSELERRDVAAFVLYLAVFGKAREEVTEMLEEDDELTLDVIRKERLPAIRRRIVKEFLDGRRVVPVSTPPSPTKALLAAAGARFKKVCAKCHGLTGHGEGPSAYALRDWKDAEIVPRDFTTGLFRAGSRLADIYMRMKTGLNGTPMPAIAATDREIWGLAYYIMGLRDPRARLGSTHPVCANREETR